MQGRTWALPRQRNALHLSLRPIADIRSAKCDRAEPPRGPIERAGRGVTLSRQSPRNDEPTVNASKPLSIAVRGRNMV